MRSRSYNHTLSSQWKAIYKKVFFWTTSNENEELQHLKNLTPVRHEHFPALKGGHARGDNHLKGTVSRINFLNKQYANIKVNIHIEFRGRNLWTTPSPLVGCPMKLLLVIYSDLCIKYSCTISRDHLQETIDHNPAISPPRIETRGGGITAWRCEAVRNQYNFFVILTHKHCRI